MITLTFRRMTNENFKEIIKIHHHHWNLNTKLLTHHNFSLFLCICTKDVKNLYKLTWIHLMPTLVFVSYKFPRVSLFFVKWGKNVSSNQIYLCISQCWSQTSCCKVKPWLVKETAHYSGRDANNRPIWPTVLQESRTKKNWKTTRPTPTSNPFHTTNTN